MLFSVIYKENVANAFKQILEYYVPYRNGITVIDSTASEMKMWDSNLVEKYKPISIDIDKSKNPKFVCSCDKIDKFFSAESVDCIIYDPPYIDLSNRNDSIDRESIYSYSMMHSLFDFEQLTSSSSKSFAKVLKKDGILICKITNFHWDNKLHGIYDLVNWFSNEFYLWDEIVYRFYKHIPNMNWYKKKCIKTHSYFLIFKKR